MNKSASILILFLTTLGLSAQNVGVGQWKDYLPYNNSISVVKVGDRVYTATENSLFYLDANDRTINRVNKINGLSDAGISCMEKKQQ
ncbi:hypothetical protein N8962_01555 [Flavobacteriales bacterium]|nr:hypothetical protein [Flavobacteriales bacterium]